MRLLLFTSTACLIALDWASTTAFLSIGHVEGNPLARPITDAGPIIHGTFRIIEILILAAYARWSPRPTVPLLIVNALMCIVVAFNLAVTFQPIGLAALALPLTVLAGTAAVALMASRHPHKQPPP